ncbi:unnamed protein product [Cuscuta epithymum]|uniref:Secreted protein n=1 Tax=Cuscuta epithymum TaxID=186058 RepID=A0AAV0F9M6_9ASTE|nr:unnamed protein product [Cuscuta epithymum]
MKKKKEEEKRRRKKRLCCALLWILYGPDVCGNVIVDDASLPVEARACYLHLLTGDIISGRRGSCFLIFFQNYQTLARGYLFYYKLFLGLACPCCWPVVAHDLPLNISAIHWFKCDVVMYVYY